MKHPLLKKIQANVVLKDEVNGNRMKKSRLKKKKMGEKYK